MTQMHIFQPNLQPVTGINACIKTLMFTVLIIFTTQAL